MKENEEISKLVEILSPDCCVEVIPQTEESNVKGSQEREYSVYCPTCWAWNGNQWKHLCEVQHELPRHFGDLSRQNRKYLGFLVEIVIELIGADKIAYKCTFIEIIRMIILNVNFNHLALMEIKVN